MPKRTSYCTIAALSGEEGKPLQSIVSLQQCARTFASPPWGMWVMADRATLHWGMADRVSNGSPWRNSHLWEKWLSPVGAGVEGDISISSHKTLLLLEATGLPSGGLKSDHPQQGQMSSRCQQGKYREQQVGHCTTQQCKWSSQNDGLWCSSCCSALFTKGTVFLTKSHPSCLVYSLTEWGQLSPAHTRKCMNKISHQNDKCYPRSCIP